MKSDLEMNKLKVMLEVLNQITAAAGEARKALDALGWVQEEIRIDGAYVKLFFKQNRENLITSIREVSARNRAGIARS